MEISKELLSEVLGHSDICNERIIQNKLLYMCKNDGMIDYEYEYNIYELAHKCKEWALSKGYDLVCKIKHKLSKAYYYECNIEQLCEANLIFYYNDEETSENSEVEAIIKACEWILDNKPL